MGQEHQGRHLPGLRSALAQRAMAQVGAETVEPLDALPSSWSRREEACERKDFGLAVVVAGVGDEGRGLREALMSQPQVVRSIEADMQRMQLARGSVGCG
jgi:hypothetical protein